VTPVATPVTLGPRLGVQDGLVNRDGLGAVEQDRLGMVLHQDGQWDGDGERQDFGLLKEKRESSGAEQLLDLLALASLDVRGQEAGDEHHHRQEDERETHLY